MRSDDRNLWKGWAEQFSFLCQFNRSCWTFYLLSENWHVKSRDSPRSSVNCHGWDVNSCSHLFDTCVLGLRTQSALSSIQRPNQQSVFCSVKGDRVKIGQYNNHWTFVNPSGVLEASCSFQGKYQRKRIIFFFFLPKPFENCLWNSCLWEDDVTMLSH